jgi:hypothetical protein
LNTRVNGTLSGLRGSLRGARIDHVQDPVRAPHLVPRAADALRFGGIGRLAQPRGVDQVERQPVEVHPLTQHVAGRARRVGHDGDLIADEPVEKARLAGVGFAGDHHRQPLAEQRALGGRRFDGAEALEHACQAIGDRRRGPNIDLFVRKVDRRLDVHAKVREQRLELPDARRKLPPHGAHRRACGRFGAGVDQIGHRLRLRDVHLAVQEGALAELPRPRGAAAELERTAHQQIEHEHSAVAEQLEHILARERRRRGVVHGDSPIDDIALGIEEGGEAGPAWGGSPPEERAGDARHVGPGQPHDADGAPPRCARDGRDGVVEDHPASLRPWD